MQHIELRARHDARLRRPRGQAQRAHARRRVRLGVQRDRHDRRRGAGLRARAQRRRAGLDRRGPLRGARADRRRGERRRRAALLALQVLRPAPRHGLRSRTSCSRSLAPLQGAAGADRPARAPLRDRRRWPTSCSPASTRRSTTCERDRRHGGDRRPTSARSASASSTRCRTRRVYGLPTLEGRVPTFLVNVGGAPAAEVATRSPSAGSASGRTTAGTR